MKHKSDGDTICNWSAQYSHHRISTGTGGLGNKGTTGDYPNYSIIKIGQNTEKSPEDFRILAVTQTFGNITSSNAAVKTLKRVN